MTRLIFLGPPGAGKGTQAVKVAEFCQIPHISTGELLRSAVSKKTQLGKKAQEYMDRGELVPDNLILDMVRDRLSQSDVIKGWILDGFPRNVAQISFLDALLTEIHQECDYAVNLEVPDDELISRMLARGRHDDNQETISRRLQVYRAETAPVIDYYQKQNKLVSVNGNLPMNEVTEELKTAIAA